MSLIIYAVIFYLVMAAFYDVSMTRMFNKKVGAKSSFIGYLKSPVLTGEGILWPLNLVYFVYVASDYRKFTRQK